MAGPSQTKFNGHGSGLVMVLDEHHGDHIVQMEHRRHHSHESRRKSSSSQPPTATSSSKDLNLVDHGHDDETMEPPCPPPPPPSIGGRKFAAPLLSIDTTDAQRLVLLRQPQTINHEDNNNNNNNNNASTLVQCDRPSTDVTKPNDHDNDTPVPTPPPPPNSFKLPLLLHHHQHFYGEPEEEGQQHQDHEQEASGSGLIHRSQQQHHHHHHHHHHHQHHHPSCMIHSQQAQPLQQPQQHKRKRRHRESKRNRFRFSFRSKNSVAISSTSSTCASVGTKHGPQHQHPHPHPHQQHHHHEDLMLADFNPTTTNQPPSPQTRASSITSSASDQSVTNSTILLDPKQIMDIHSNKPNGGLKSKKLKTLVHPLDRSIVGIFLLTIFFTILALLTGTPIVLFLMLLLPIFIFMRKLFQCQFASHIPNHEPVSSLDAYWLQKGHITHCLLYVDKGLSAQQLRDVLATRLLTKPELARFKSRLIHKGLCRSPYWKYEPDLDNFDDHVIEDDPVECKKTLRKRLISFMSQTLPMDKPLWQIRYSVATYCDQVLLIIRVHQSLSQSGLVSILTHYLCDSVPVCSGHRSYFGGTTLSINMLRAIIVGPLTFFLWIMWAFTRRHYNYLTKSKEIKSIHWSTLDLPKIFRIKQVTRSTLNDVLLACIAGSIRAYLTEQTNIINPPDLTVTIPVDITPCGPNETSPFGVNYVLTSSPIPTNTEGAIPRLWEVRHLMEELKTSADTAVMYGSHYLLSRFLPGSLYRMLMNLVNRNSSIYMSNLSGPEQSLSIGSHRLNKIYYFLSAPSYCSIVYNIFTYDNKLYMSIQTNSKLLTSAKELMKQFRAQIGILHELLSKRRVPGESKRSKRTTTMLLQAEQQPQQQQQHQQQPQQQPSSVLMEMDPVYVQSNQPSPSSLMEPLPADYTDRLHEIQDELNRLSGAYEMGDPNVLQHYEELKEEFTNLLYQMRRRKSLVDYGSSNVVINIEDQDDDENDGELRMPPSRRFSVVSLGRRASIVSSLPSASRVTPPILSRRSIAASPEQPSSPEVAFKAETEC